MSKFTKINRIDEHGDPYFDIKDEDGYIILSYRQGSEGGELKRLRIAVIDAKETIADMKEEIEYDIELQKVIQQ